MNETYEGMKTDTGRRMMAEVRTRRAELDQIKTPEEGPHPLLTLVEKIKQGSENAKPYLNKLLKRAETSQTKTNKDSLDDFNTLLEKVKTMRTENKDRGPEQLKREISFLADNYPSNGPQTRYGSYKPASGIHAVLRSINAALEINDGKNKQEALNALKAYYNARYKNTKN